MPRDTGAGWDFDDVRDHYLRQLFGVDPVAAALVRHAALPATEPRRAGEMMAAGVCRVAQRPQPQSRRAGLVLQGPLARGRLGHRRQPRRAQGRLLLSQAGLDTRQITLTDEGLDGLHLHLTNETTDSISGTVEVTLLKEPHTVVATRQAAVTIATACQQRLNAEELLGRFHDISYAYRFGPPQHDVVVATWFDADHNILGEAFHFVRRNVATMSSVDVVQASAACTRRVPTQSPCEVKNSCTACDCMPRVFCRMTTTSIFPRTAVSVSSFRPRAAKSKL